MDGIFLQQLVNGLTLGSVYGLMLKLSDRAYVMVNGEIRLTGTGKELLVNEEVRNAYLGGH